MKPMEEFELLLEKELADATRNSPAKLREACFYAVFPSGGRIRPRLGIGIAQALGHHPDRALMGGAMAIELIHCASLVHDDLPCFDDAATRRGKPSVQRKYGEGMALLAGDALIVAAFGVAAQYCAHRPELTAELITIISAAVGPSSGIIAGQAAETDDDFNVHRVHQMKTGALFEGMAAVAAVVSGEPPEPWRAVGRKLGSAYQVADDLLDAVGSEKAAGKPTLQDTRNKRPSAVRETSIATAAVHLDALIASAVNIIPPCPGRDALAAMLTGVATRLCPKSLMTKVVNTPNPIPAARKTGAAYA